ncbi:MAG TPA: hypothetical protein VFQ77_18500 [Pseudonocardiaceae bacterium]|nr:hypothetical protein [Pseudonocardiaceae bacterium]
MRSVTREAWLDAYLDHVASRDGRRMDPAGVWFWTKPRVRMYLLFVAAVLLAGIAVSLLVLAGALADAAGLRGVLMAGLLLALVTLLVRIGSDIVGATRA